MCAESCSDAAQGLCQRNLRPSVLEFLCRCVFKSTPRWMETFGYGHGADPVFDHDEGWGCVYRSVQNVQSFLGLPVWDMRSLVNAVKFRPGQWAEPGLFPPFAKTMFPGATAHAVLVGRSTQWLRVTSAAQYKAHFLAKSDGRHMDAYVVDDGVSAYAIVPWKGAWWWVDPHVGPSPPMVPFKPSFLDGQSGWMVLQVRVALS